MMKDKEVSFVLINICNANSLELIPFLMLKEVHLSLKKICCKINPDKKDFGNFGTGLLDFFSDHSPFFLP